MFILNNLSFPDKKQRAWIFFAGEEKNDKTASF